MLQSDNPWFSLVSRPGHALLEQTVEETAQEAGADAGILPVTREQILKLYHKYVSEWTVAVEEALGYGLLSSNALSSSSGAGPQASRNNPSEEPIGQSRAAQGNRGTSDDPRVYRQMHIDEFIERSGHATYISTTVDIIELGIELQAARKQAGLTQEQAALIIGVARTTMTAIESGERRIKEGELIKVSWGLRASTERFPPPSSSDNLLRCAESTVSRIAPTDRRGNGRHRTVHL